MRYLIALLFFNLSVPTLLYAADKHSVTNDILTLSGLKEQTQEIASFALNEIENRKQGLAEEEYTRLKNIVNLTFNQNRLYEVVQRYFTDHYDDKLSPLWLTILKTPLMKKVATLEHDSANPSSFNHIIEYAQLLQENPPPPMRIELVQKLDTITHASRLALESQLSVTKVLLHAINPSLPSNKQMGTTQLQGMIDALRMQITERLQQVSTLTYLYTYRSLSNEELAQYVTHYGSPEGQWIAETTYQAIMSALEDARLQFHRRASNNPNNDSIFVVNHAVDITYNFDYPR